MRPDKSILSEPADDIENSKAVRKRVPRSRTQKLARAGKPNLRVAYGMPCWTIVSCLTIAISRVSNWGFLKWQPSNCSSLHALATGDSRWRTLLDTWTGLKTLPANISRKPLRSGVCRFPKSGPEQLLACVVRSTGKWNLKPGTRILSRQTEPRDYTGDIVSSSVGRPDVSRSLGSTD